MTIEGMENKALIEQIKAITSPEELAAVDAQIRAMPGKMSADVQQAVVDKMAEMTAKSKTDREEIISILKVNGVDYPLTDWLTPANYAKRFGIEGGRQVVNNWVNRGVIPAENVKEIPELDLRLVRAVAYSPRPYKTAATNQEAAQ